MKFKELKSMSKEEIKAKLSELQMELVKSNAQIATGTIPKNPGQVKQTKKTIAKIKQILASPESEEKKESKKEAPKKTEGKKEEKSQSSKSNKESTNKEETKE